MHSTLSHPLREQEIVKEIQKNINCFGTRIRSLLEFCPHLADSTKPLILVSLGCGIPSDALAFYLFFKKFNIPFKYIGIDKEVTALHFMTEYLNTHYEGKKWASFLSIDISDVSAINKALSSQKADIVICRHPIFNHPTYNHHTQGDFSDCIKNVLPQILKSGGTVMATFYQAWELEHFKNLIIMPINIKKTQEADIHPYQIDWHGDKNKKIQLSYQSDSFAFWINNWNTPSMQGKEIQFTPKPSLNASWMCQYGFFLAGGLIGLSYAIPSLIKYFLPEDNSSDTLPTP